MDLFLFYKADLAGNVYSRKQGFWKKMALCRKPNGYLKFNARVFTNTEKAFYVHRFVWAYFKGEIPVGIQVNHVDCNKANNALSNLELLTPTENMQHAVRMGRPVGQGNRRGIKNGRAKLTEKDVLKIRKLLKKYSISEVARQFMMGKTAISDIKHRRMWVHI